MAAVVLAAVTLTVLVCLMVRRVLDVRWWSVLGPLLAAGFIAGTGWRVMTAGVIGTNIGAGFVILFSSPVVATLLTWALARSIYLGTGGATRQRPPTADRHLATVAVAPGRRHPAAHQINLICTPQLRIAEKRIGQAERRVFALVSGISRYGRWPSPSRHHPAASADQPDRSPPSGGTPHPITGAERRLVDRHVLTVGDRRSSAHTDGWPWAAA